MLNRISLRISTEIMKRAWNIRYGQEVYTYGIEIILSTLAEIISILISAIVFSSFIEGIIFVIVFSSLRLFAGGYHAETYKKCFGVTLGVFLLTLSIANVTSKLFCEKIFWVLLCLVSIYIITRAPVLNKNQPLSEHEILINVKIVSIICIICIFINIEFLQYNKALLSMMVCTICSVAVLMLITDIIKTKGGKKKHGNYCKDY